VKLAGRAPQHVSGRLGTSAESDLAERADQSTGELDIRVGWVDEPCRRAGVEELARSLGGSPRPVEGPAAFGRRDLRRFPDVTPAVHVHVQATLLELVYVLGERLRSVEYLSDLA
jgi:hypothetical protein